MPSITTWKCKCKNVEESKNGGDNWSLNEYLSAHCIKLVQMTNTISSSWPNPLQVFNLYTLLNTPESNFRCFSNYNYSSHWSFWPMKSLIWTWISPSFANTREYGLRSFVILLCGVIYSLRKNPPLFRFTTHEIDFEVVPECKLLKIRWQQWCI